MTRARDLLILVIGLACALSLDATPLVTHHQAQTDGAIFGSVIDGTTGQPIPGALITIGGGGGVANPKQLSDAQGRFAFVRLPKVARFTIAATKHGYLDGGYGSVPVDPAARHQIDVSGQPVTIRIVLWRGATVAGSIVSEEGEPLSGVTVRILRRWFIAGHKQWLSSQQAITDDRGRYRMTAIVPGDYVLVVPSVQVSVPDELQPSLGLPAAGVAAISRLNSALARQPAIGHGINERLLVGPFPAPPPGRNRMVYRPTFWPSSATIQNASVLSLQFADIKDGLDIRITPVDSVRVSGKLIGEGAASLESATIRLLEQGSDYLGSGLEVATAVVGRGGQFSFPRVPAGNYTVLVRKVLAEFGKTSSAFWDGRDDASPGFLAYGRSNLRIRSLPGEVNLLIRSMYGEDFWGRAQLTVGTTDLDNVVVQTHRAASISGKIRWERSNPTTRLLNLLPRLEPADGRPSAAVAPPPTRFAPKEPEQEFTLAGAISGAYLLRFEAAAWTIKSIEWNGSDYSDRPFELSADTEVRGVTVTMTDQLSLVSGSVADDMGRPVAGSGVVVFSSNRRHWANYGFEPSRIRWVLANGSGLFSVVGLPPGEYLATALADSDLGSWADPDFLGRAAASAVKINVTGSHQASQLVNLRRAR